MFGSLKATYFSKCHIWCSGFFFHMNIIFCDFHFHGSRTHEKLANIKGLGKWWNLQYLELRINRPIQLLIALWMTAKCTFRRSVPSCRRIWNPNFPLYRNGTAGKFGPNWPQLVPAASPDKFG